MVAWHLYLNQVDVKEWTQSMQGPKGHKGKYPVHPPDRLHPWSTDSAYYNCMRIFVFDYWYRPYFIYSITSNPQLSVQENWIH